MCRPMASGNGEAAVVELPVMRFYRRTGPDTAISHGLGMLGLVVFVTILVLASLSQLIGTAPTMIMFMLIPVILAVVTTKARREHSEYVRLTALDRKAEQQADLQRLRSKYKNR